MTPLETAKLGRFKLMFGEITSEQAILLAIENEQYKKACGPFDPAFQLFAREQAGLEEYALLIEKTEAMISC